MLLLAFKPEPGYRNTLTVGPVTTSWDDWTHLLLVASVTLTLLSSFLAYRYGRWWMTVLIALPMLLIAQEYRNIGSGAAPDDYFHFAWKVFTVLVPLVIVHAALSFALPKRKRAPAEPASRYNSP